MGLYRLFIGFYFFLINIGSGFRKDAAAWVKGRKNWRTRYSKLNPERKKSIWIHCSSLGEFEQGRSLLEKIRKEHPREHIWLSFFSPSGYEIRKDYNQVDAVSYFPSDRKKDVLDFLEIVNPKWVIFVKYDYWFELLFQLNQRQIPFVYISIFWKPGYFLEAWWAPSLRLILSESKHFYAQDDRTATVLKSFFDVPVSISGDTRMDRVIEIASESWHLEALDTFCKGHSVMVCGSVWREDLILLSEAIRHPDLLGWKWIVVPHRTEEAYILEAESQVAGRSQRLSGGLQDVSCRVCIVDTIGMLSRLYRYARLCYVGGGFGKSIHNILEAAAYQKPVCFGPRHHKFPEASAMIQNGFGFEITNAQTLAQLMLNSENPEWLNQITKPMKSYLQENSGSTEKIYQSLTKQYKFPSEI